MGTNYCLHTKVCEHCGRSDEPLHIGKSSGGWCFALHVMPEDGINDLDDWIKRFPTGVIRNEYGKDVSVAEMLRTITERSWSGHSNRDPEFHLANESEEGPRGLVRHRIGRYCVKHGAGTWDCMVGDFS